MQDPLDISHEISSALTRNEPVVALESSLIAHGLPSAVNVKTALEMEEAVRGARAIPATIGIIEGKVRVGLTKDEIETLGKGGAAKVASRDIPYTVSRKLYGGTCVSATARIAAAAGIAVMATGGIGGVHRGFAETHDVSADLWELARTPVIVICSGAKSVLDIPATLEWLESHSVPVYGYETDDFPAFYSRSSGITVPQMEDQCDVAELAKVSGGAFGVRYAMVIGAPIPEADAIDVTAEMDEAAKEAAKAGVVGKDLTPYLLNKVAELTGGKSIEANVALLKNNARVAGEIAREIAETQQRRMGFLV